MNQGPYGDYQDRMHQYREPPLLSGFWKFMIGFTIFLFAFVIAPIMWLVGIYNKFPTQVAAIEASEKLIHAAYQKRHDMIPNVAAVAEKYMTEEQKTIIGHAQARTTGVMPVLPENATPEQIEKYNKQIAEMSQPGNTLMRMVKESVPNIKADAQFMVIQKRMDDVEMQIGILRKRYIEKIQGYNVLVTTIPGKWVASYGNFKVKPQIEFPDLAASSQSPQLFRKAPVIK